MMSCRDVSGLVSAGNLETASFRRRMSVWMHLAMCRHCRRFKRQLEWLRRNAKTAANEAAQDMPTDLTDRILRRLPKD